MKRTARWAGVFVAGLAIACITNLTLGNLWLNLGWRKPVADWLLSKGFPQVVAANWGLVWINLPDWTVALLLGALIGRLTRGKWLPHALFFGGGFAGYRFSFTVATYLWYLGLNRPLPPDLASRTFWRSLPWDLVPFLLLLLMAWLLGRPRVSHPVSTEAPPVAER